MARKIIAWLDSNFITFSLLYHLQKKIDCEFYAIVDITDESKEFFIKQDFIKFKKIWFYYDSIDLSKKKYDQKYLSKFEEKHGINLCELAINERTFYQFNSFYKFTSNEILSILEQECKLFEDIINQVKPDFCITKEIIQHKDSLFVKICRSNKIPVLTSSLLKLINKYSIYQKFDEFDIDFQLKDIEIEDKTFEELRTYLQKTTNVCKLQIDASEFLNSKIQKLKAATRYLLQSNSNIKTHYTYFGRTKVRVLLYEIKSVINKKHRKNFIDKNLLQNLDLEENFVYFPLHVDQENSILIATPYHTNQVEIIRQIVKSLPIGYKLYVKEHFAQSTRNWRDIRTYKEIMDIPNVKLFHPDTNNKKFFEKCSLVISIAGSSALEATFYEKPSIIFCKLNFTILPSIFYVESLFDLSKTIRTALTTKINPNELNKYLTFVKKNTFHFDIHDYSKKELKTFFFEGQLIDVKIPINKMKIFLEDNSIMFEDMVSAYIKKISWFENANSSK
jgi:hypothetical protein